MAEVPLPAQPEIADSVLDLIGSTPLVRLSRMPQLDGVGKRAPLSA